MVTKVKLIGDERTTIEKRRKNIKTYNSKMYLGRSLLASFSFLGLGGGLLGGLLLSSLLLRGDLLAGVFRLTGDILGGLLVDK